MHILHVTTASQPIAGAERLLLDIAQEARDREHELSFLTLEPQGEFHEQLDAMGWTTGSLEATRPRQILQAVSGLRQTIASLGPDLLHAHLFHGTVLASAGAVGMGLPLIQTRHYSDYMDRYGDPFRRRLDHWAANRADRVIAVSLAAEEHLTQVAGVPPERVEVIPNGVDVERLGRVDPKQGERVLRELGIDDGPLVGCAATYHPRKGHRYLIEAMSRVCKELPTAHLVLLGRGTGDGGLVGQARKLDIEDRVHGLGFHPEGQAIMAALDLYVQPSVEEGFGLAVVEAMAMGLPVVVSDVGGMRHTVIHGSSGIRVPPADPPALADAILRTLKEPSLARRLGEAGRARASEAFSIQRMVDEHERIYEHVLASKR